MKQILAVIFILIVSLFIFRSAIYAHSRGIPILKINGGLTRVYPIEYSSLTPFLSDSSDIASENYLVNQNLEFEFEASRSAEIPLLEGSEQMIYVWDFGDGTEKQKNNTPKNNHTYTKMGSYIMTILADYSQAGLNNTPQPLVVQSTLFHILPNKNYKLPEPVIKINDQIISSSNKYVDFDFNKRITFDASLSKSASSKIIEYQWDVGQGDAVKSKTTSHKYKLPQFFATVILRVKDENGFMVDTFVELSNSGKNEPSGFNLEEFITPTVLLILAQLVAVTLGITWYLRRKRKKI